LGDRKAIWSIKLRSNIGGSLPEQVEEEDPRGEAAHPGATEKCPLNGSSSSASSISKSKI